MSTTKALPRPTAPNVIRAFWRATDQEIADGRAWYKQAHALAEDLAESVTHNPADAFEFDYQVRQAVGVIAALSPQVSWERNVTMAQRVYDAFLADVPYEELAATWPGLKINLGKAWRILNGAHPLEVYGTKSPKVTAFYHAILNPNDPRGIVIDRHAFDVAVGRVMTDEIRGKVLGRKGAYETFVRAYERAAQVLRSEYSGITPAEVQAITWVAWRRAKKES